RIDGNATRRTAILVVFAGAAEIAGALEGEPVRRRLRAVHDAEPRKTEIGRQLALQSRTAVIEILCRIDDRLHLSAGDDIDPHRKWIEFVDMEKANRQKPRFISPKSLFRAKFYFLNDVKIDFIDDFRRGSLGGDIGLRRKIFGTLPERREVKR